MSEENIVSYTAEEAHRKIANGEDKTDWAYVDALTDEQIEEAARSDADECLDGPWTEAALVMPRGKKTQTLRIDADVLDWFRQQGKGYQTRINAVLRTYYEAYKN